MTQPAPCLHGHTHDSLGSALACAGRGVRELGANCDNVTASTLGEASAEAGREHVGDSIDHGLRLLRLLRERGFVVVAIPRA